MPRIEVVGGQDVFVTVEFEKPYYERLQMASIIRAKDEAENMGLFPCSHFRIKVQWLRTDRVWGQKVWAIRGFRTKILNLTWLFKNKLHATSDIHTQEKRGREKGRVTVTWHTLIGVRKMDHSDMHFSFLEILLLQKYENRFQPRVGLKQEIIKKVSALYMVIFFTIKGLCVATCLLVI